MGTDAGLMLANPDDGSGVDATHPCAVHGSDLKPGRVESTYLFLQLVCIGKGVISKVHVALEGKRELAVDKKSGGSWFVVEPMEYGLEWIQALIKGKHCFRGETVVVYRHLGRGDLRVRDRISVRTR